MSTVNTENLTLYAIPELYNGSRYVCCQEGVDYDTWLTEHSTSHVAKTVYYKGLSEPLELKASAGDLLKYTYGRLTNDNHTYYIFIDGFDTDQHNMTWIRFSVDWWATCWDEITLTKAHVLNQNLKKPGYMLQSVSELNLEISSVPAGDQGCFMATYIPNSEDYPSYLTYLILPADRSSAMTVEGGEWSAIYGVSSRDLKDCFVVPHFSYEYFMKNHVGEENNIYVINTAFVSDVSEYVTENFTGDYMALPNSLVFDPSSGDYGRLVYETLGNKWHIEFEPMTFGRNLMRYICRCDATGIKEQFLMFTPRVSSDRTMPSIRQYSKSFDVTFTSDELTREGLMDWNGNMIWEASPNAGTFSFRTRLLLGISHVMVEFVPSITLSNDASIVNRGFTYDCRHPGLFVDSYAEYIMKNRDYDIEMRRIQSDKELWHSIASVIENIGFGAAFGGVNGAIAAGVGGSVEAAATFLINANFDPQIQRQYDKLYARMTDQISLVGDSITNAIRRIDSGDPMFSKYTITVTDDSRDRYEQYIHVNGYDSDEMTDDLQSYVHKGGILRADNVVVEGCIPMDARTQTVYRLSNGVQFI